MQCLNRFTVVICNDVIFVFCSTHDSFQCKEKIIVFNHTAHCLNTAQVFIAWIMDFIVDIFQSTLMIWMQFTLIQLYCNLSFDINAWNTLKWLQNFTILKIGYFASGIACVFYCSYSSFVWSNFNHLVNCILLLSLDSSEAKLNLNYFFEIHLLLNDVGFSGENKRISRYLLSLRVFKS